MKQLKITKILFILIYLTAIYTVAITKHFNNIEWVKENNVLNICIAWIPVVAFFIVSVIYSFFMCTEKLLSARKYIYCSLLFQLITITIIMLPLNISQMLKWIIWVIIISLNFIISEICNLKIENKVSSIDFSLSDELNTMDEVKKTIQQSPNYKYSKQFNRVWLLYVILFCIPLNPVVFGVLTVIVAGIAFYNMYKYHVEYCSALGSEKAKQIFIIGSVAYWFFIGLGIVLYYLLDFKFPSFITIFASFLPKYICDNKYAIKLRKNKKL